MPLMRCWVLALALIGALSGCQMPPPDAFVNAAGPAATPVGNDDAGEPCRYQLISNSVAGGRGADLYCGNWDQPSGRIVELGGPADRARLDAIARSGPWRADIDRRFTCGEPTPTHILSDAPAELMQCTRRVGGWPQLALGAIVDGRIFGIDAVQPALPAVEAALASLNGQPVAATASSSEARQLIARRGGAAAFGSGDEGRFFQELRLGDAYNNLDEPVDAERAYRQALAIQQKTLGPTNPAVAPTMMKLAAQLAHQGDAGGAQRLLAQAAQLIENQHGTLPAAQLDFYRATAAAYAMSGPATPAESAQRLTQTIELVQRAEAEFALLVPKQAAAMKQAGPPSAAGGGVIGAGDLASLVTDESPNTEQERGAISGLAEAMRLHATLLQFAGRFAEASELARRTQRLLVGSGLSVSSTAARSLRLLASNQAESGEYPAAAGTSAEAAQVFGRIAAGEHPEAMNLLSQGYYQLKSGQLDAALDSFRRAAAILRSPTVTGGVPPDSVISWLDALAAAPGDRAKLDAQMFDAAQFAESENTAQAISRATVALLAGDPKAATVIRSLDERKSKLDQLEARRIATEQEKAPAESLAALDQQIAAEQSAVDQAESAIQATLPQYQRVAEKPAALTDVQKLLAPDEALAFFLIADAGSYGFFVRPNAVIAYKIPLTRGRVSILIGRLRKTTIEVKPTATGPGGLPTPDFAASYELYSGLFGPVEKQLDTVKEIVVATTGDLLRYPLEALVTRAGVTVASGDFRQVPFLVRRVALAYVPAPRVLVNIRSGRAAGSALRPFIGFGDFRPATPAQLVASFPPQSCGEDSQRLQFPPLPDTRTQVVTLARELGAGPDDVVLGDAFTKDRLAQPQIGQYRVVLLATHGFFPTKADNLRCFSDPAIVVSPAPRAANADGEFERPKDIQRLQLNADVVVLSACDTSGADAGDSLSGLARAFFLAGARGLLVTHWDIVTAASVPLMVDTFGAGNGAHDSAQGLRAAQLHMIDSAGSGPQVPIELSHPNYWAAFVLIGDGIRSGTGA